MTQDTELYLDKLLRTCANEFVALNQCVITKHHSEV